MLGPPLPERESAVNPTSSSPCSSTTPLRSLGVALLLVPALGAQAAEIDIEGFYRARGRIYETLSIDRALTNQEGTSAWLEHRFVLRPKILINDKLGVFADIRGFDNLRFGHQPVTWFDPTSQLGLPQLLSDDLRPPGDGGDATLPVVDISLWRAWGEVHLGDHRFSLGRMPLHWGAGVWQNDGLGLTAEFGDSVDRLQWEGLFNDQIYGSLALDLNTRGFVNSNDLTWSVNGLAAWRTEQLVAGLNLQYRRSTSSEVGVDPAQLFTADVALDVTLGPLSVKLEALVQLGGGDLDNGLNDVQIAAGGGVVDLGLTIPQADLRFRYALATGDDNPNDQRIKTFYFDRDYNFGIILFEQPMPTLAAALGTPANGGRDYSIAQTGPTVSNAMVFAPEIARTFGDLIELRAMGVIGVTAKLPELAENESRRYYGSEFDLSVAYVGLESLDVILTGAVFVPGGYIKNYDGLGLSNPVWGGQLLVRFGF